MKNRVLISSEVEIEIMHLGFVLAGVLIQQCYCPWAKYFMSSMSPKVFGILGSHEVIRILYLSANKVLSTCGITFIKPYYRRVIGLDFFIMHENYLPLLSTMLRGQIGCKFQVCSLMDKDTEVKCRI